MGRGSMGASRKLKAWHAPIDTYPMEKAMATRRFASEAPEKKTWDAMMNRCYNASAKDYLPGITVCKRWHVFKAFLADVGLRPSDDHMLRRNSRKANFGPETTSWVARHNKTQTRVYQIWKNMRYRSGAMGNGNGPTAEHYAERGITCCERWNDFYNFIEDMGEPPDPTLTLERKDNTKGYYKENCKWATHVEQQNNTSRNKRVIYGGVQKTVAEWCRELKLDRDNVYQRLKMGWSAEEAFDMPTKVYQGVVVQENVLGGIIALHANPKAAARDTGITYQALMKCLSGANKTSGGFRWYYKK